MKKLSTLLSLAMIFLIGTSFRTTQPGYQVGDQVKDFALKNVNGKTVALSDYKRVKGFIVVFTCNHCPFAQAYEQRIIDLHNKYNPIGYPVIAINPNDPAREPEDSYENMQKRAKEKNYPFVYLFDETQYIAQTFGATRTPHVFLLSRNSAGNKVEYIGAIDDNTEDAQAVTVKYVENAIQELETGKRVTTSFTKAIGCSIKWKKAE